MKKLSTIVLFYTLITGVIVCVATTKVSAQVHLNEFFPNPDGADGGYEWVELYNNSDEETLLTNWSVVSISATGNARSTALPEIRIPPKTYYVVAEELVLFEGLNAVSLHESFFNMYNDGERIRLLDETGTLTDELTYGQTLSGRSWERPGFIDTPECETLTVHPESHSIGTINANNSDDCWEEEIDTSEAEITGIQFRTALGSWSDTIRSYGKTEIDTMYSFSGDAGLILEEHWYLDDGTEFIPPFVTDNYQNKAIKLEVILQNENMLTKTSENVFIFPNTIQISELYPSPDTINGEEEWVELYNWGDTPVLLEGWLLQDAGLGTYPISIAEIAPHSYLLLDGLSFSLNNSGDAIMLLGSDSTQIDFLQYESTPKGSSVNRVYSDGQYETDAVYVTQEITPGTQNIPNGVDPGEDGTVYSNHIIISEIYPEPLTSEGESEWLELYNFGDEEIDLDKWMVTNSSGSKTTLANMVVPSHSYIVLPDETIPALKNSSDTIALINPAGEEIDGFVYTESLSQYSLARAYDETNSSYNKHEMYLSPSPTPGAQNKPIAELETTSIGEAKGLPLGSMVQVRGVVSVDVGLFGEGILYLQDETGGIRSENSTVQFLEGTEIMIQGVLLQKSGELVIDVKKSDLLRGDVPILGEALADENIESRVGMLSAIDGTIVKNFSSSFDVETQYGQIIRVSIGSSTGISLPEKKKGDLVQIVGILVPYENGYKLLPRKDSDILIHASIIAQTASNPEESTSQTRIKPTMTYTNLYASEKDLHTYSIPNLEVTKTSLESTPVEATKNNRNTASLYAWPFYLCVIGLLILYYYELPKKVIAVLQRYWNDNATLHPDFVQVRGR